MYRRVNNSDTPPGGWRYLVEDTGKEFSGVNYSKYGLSKLVEDYLRANGKAIPDNLEELIEDYTCRQIQGMDCEQVGPPTGPLARFQMTWAVLKAGTEAIGSWFLAGLPKVDQAKADARSEVCAGCVHNVHPSGCAPCQSDALYKLIGKLVGSSKSSQHDRLQACDRCGCSLRVKVFVPIDHIKKVEPVAPLPQWCWLSKEAGND